ncbi:type IV conjugative transfer system coupling protein TraD [Lentisalinibacter orientalis]|uniref:type IV conjugative transfer system coupling protein TraD n=1 Tax=Lentisalinibacter orientalis TaxID=2992241 RepID=UPI00386B7FD7
MTGHPVEALLRPPVELWSAATAAATGTIAILAPWALMMPPGVAYGAAAVLFALAWVRARQGWRVIRYQRNLKRLPIYRLRPERIPVSRHKLFLGRGFRWTQKHTQRLRDTIRPEVQDYIQPGWLYRWARQKEVAWEAKPILRYAAALMRRDAWWNPLRPLPPVGGTPALHAVEPDEGDVWMDLRERVGHTLVLGTTRVGKTRLAEVLIAQDIRRGDTVIVFDPKGDADLLRRVHAEAKRAGRAGEFYLFHLGYPEISARYNAIGNFSRITEVATRIANQLPSEGNSAAFKEFAWRFVNIIARALVTLGRRPDYHQIRRYINDIEPLFIEYTEAYLEEHAAEGWRDKVAEFAEKVSERNLPAALKGRHRAAIGLMRYLQTLDVYDPVLDGLLSAFKYDKTYFDKIVSSVGPLMEKLTTGNIAELISPDYLAETDPRPIFEWLDMIRRKGIVYIGLDALTDTTVATAVGNSMFADLVSVAGHIYKHGLSEPGEPGDQGSIELPTVSLHADEFNELIGDEFVPLLNKAGGAGFQVTAYTQTWSDVEARIGSRARAGQVAGNFNTLVMLRVKELATAEMLTAQLPNVEVFSLMSVSGVDDSSDPESGVDFRSRNEDRISVSEVPMLSPADIIRLPKGQAFALLEGGGLWKIRMPLPDTRRDAGLPQSLSCIAAEMERSYTTGEHWYRTPETWWYAEPSRTKAPHQLP